MTEDTPPYEDRSALIVDDDPAVLLLVRRMLERLGFQVVVAADGESALETTADHRFDVVLTDVAMPGMSGIDLMREARARGLDAPVIMLTATGSVPRAVEAMKSGAFEFLEKPLRFERLAEVIEGAMEEKGPAPSTMVLGSQEVQAVGVETNKDGIVPPPAQESSLSLDISVEEPRTEPPDPPRPARRAAPPHGIHKIGRYEILNPIGRGGMGVVYRCTDPLLGRTVAVKVLQLMADTPEQQEMTERFRREAAAAGALHHPHIVAVHDLGFDEDRSEWFLVMELLEGRGLHVILASREKLKIEMSIRLGFQMADALAYAHAHRVIHRDIKPSNVHVHHDDTAKLLDFGLAAVEGWDVTLTGRVFGSPSYMAPERIQGEAGGPAADQFSLGVVLYECISGKAPFDSNIPEAKLRKVLEYHPPLLCENDAGVPVTLSDIVTRMMQKDQSDRYRDMDEVAVAFQELGSELGIELERHVASARE
jgi:CheY-like chemotaxis protein